MKNICNLIANPCSPLFSLIEYIHKITTFTVQKNQLLMKHYLILRSVFSNVFSETKQLSKQWNIF